jgi:hypothetical protein
MRKSVVVLSLCASLLACHGVGSGSKAREGGAPAGLIERRMVQMADGALHHTVLLQRQQNGWLDKSAELAATGQWVSLAQANRLMAENHRRRWGGLAPSLVARRSAGGGLQPVSAAVWFSSPSGLAAVIALVRSGSLELPPGQPEEADHVIAVHGSLDVIAELAMSGEILWVDSAYEGLIEGGYGAPYADDGAADYSLSRQFFNQDGNFASGVKVGIQEQLGRRCVLRGDHEAFAFLGSSSLFPVVEGVHYLEPPTPTSNPSDCLFACGGGQEGEPRIVNGQQFCALKAVNTTLFAGFAHHTQRVASRIASSANGTPRHAGKAVLVVDNTWGNMSPASAFPTRSNAVTKFRQAGVRIVNLSVSEGDPANYDATAHLFDFASYEHRMVFVQAAGNGSTSELGADCHALNSLCVGGTNANNSYPQAPTFSFAASTPYLNARFKNPYGIAHPFGPGDEERPDVVSEAESARTADPSGGWLKSTGTSYAAPVVAGLVAQVMARCQANGHTYDGPEWYRAVMRNAAEADHTLNPTTNHLVYPTPGRIQSPCPISGPCNPRDYRTGTGIATARVLASLCGPIGPDECERSDAFCTTTRSGDFAKEMWEPVPEWMRGSANENEGEVTQGTVATVPNGLSPTGGASWG